MPDGHGPSARVSYAAAVGMFLVLIRRTGPSWVAGKPMEEQSGWDAHASFMDNLVAEGFVVLGGPLSDGERVMHAVEAASEDEIRARFATDPWSGSHLVVDTIEPWTIRLDGRKP